MSKKKIIVLIVIVILLILYLALPFIVKYELIQVSDTAYRGSQTKGLHSASEKIFCYFYFGRIVVNKGSSEPTIGNTIFFGFSSARSQCKSPFLDYFYADWYQKNINNSYKQY